MQNQILIVHADRDFAKQLGGEVLKAYKMPCQLATSTDQARNMLDAYADRFYLAIVDVDFPDVCETDIVDLISEAGVPSMVLTNVKNADLRRKLFSKNIVDYWIKEYGSSTSYVVSAIGQLRRNEDVKVLVVDDSTGFRRLVQHLLIRKKFKVLEAENGIHALQLLMEHRDVRLIVTDYEMPQMSGFQLVREVRNHFGKHKIAILGLSSSEEHGVTAKLLKAGANDFLKKPFEVEEFYCRIDQNLEIIQMFELIEETSNTDFLTKLFNRKYFFEICPPMFQRAARDGQTYALAMMDIDHFKKVNDGYGHDGGDEVLRKVAAKLKQQFRPQDLVSRFGGEEFCVVFGPIDHDAALAKLENLRIAIAAMAIPFEKANIQITMSIGMCLSSGDSVEETIRTADQRLYLAKNGGRNRVVARD
ncbi:Diguanylate cyclase [Sulfidibacter corallicola]|uniref:diguanylate cyclase n=1 Tax=Sulfidibacter corallicola TaxID=2818388 RepID=A0A8A4TKZ5_SULCO|nr:diguanylate cyclase [Sulfidibacter corallicola]QTD49874.1 diguanylate cyclase [Sulfidibacter corallicola]